MPQVRGSFLYFHSNLTSVLKVINGEDLEQRAVACLTFARCIIVAGDSTREPFIYRLGTRITHTNTMRKLLLYGKHFRTYPWLR